MNRRRWVVGAVLAVATLLLVGRVVAGWYVDYLWYDALGARALWYARTMDLLILRGGAFLAGTTFVFLNLWAVRHSVESLVLPRRVGNLEIGEEVPGQYLMVAVVSLSLVLGLLLALPHGDWTSVDLLRHGEPFRESDPYFQFDLAFWVYWLPLESALHLWALISVLAVSLVVVVLYALTPSLRWDGGRLRVTAYVRRHLFVLAAAVLVILAWSYRLDSYRLLLEGSGAQSAFNALDHRVGIPANLVLSIGTIAAAMLLVWAGWFGQLRLAFATVSAVLLSALALRQIVPPVAERFLSPGDQEQRDAPYFKTRAGYTRRAYDVDRVARPESVLTARSNLRLLRGASLWDPAALERAISRERRPGRPLGTVGWEAADGRLRAVVVEQPAGTEAAEPLAPWGTVRIESDLATEQGTPVTDAGPNGEESLPPAVVFDSAPGYSIVLDSTQRIAAPPLASFAARLAHAWALQNPRLLRGNARETERAILYRRVRQRVERLYPFFQQGARIAPVVHRDSLWWSLHLYATSQTYPLSDPVRLTDASVRYLQHAGVALINAHTGRAIVAVDPAPDPVTTSWMRRFPALFIASTALDRELLERIPPPAEASFLHARLFALLGPRGENGPPSRLPRQVGGDTLFSLQAQAPYLDTLTQRLSVAYPVVDASERVRGLVIAAGGADYDVRWEPAEQSGARWGAILDRLHRAIDSASQGVVTRESPLVRGAVRAVPTGGAQAYIQTAYAWRTDGAPAVRLVAVLANDTVRTGATIAAAAGLPAPAVPSTPLTPAEFRARVESLYAEMREALKRGDWLAFGNAYEALGRVLRSTSSKP
ncbi:MAG: UPF0182 family protein [Gemmatimonadaceae bacterium]|nr:UPF0182 family protein [Gemmatimonadaceae bacterium]